MSSLFFFSSSADHRDLHSFPTRRSSDLARTAAAAATFTIVPRHVLGQGETPPSDMLGGALIGCGGRGEDRKSTRLNSSHMSISYAVFCLKKKKINHTERQYSIYTND